MLRSLLTGKIISQSGKVVIILKAMAFLNLSAKNSNRGREFYTSHLLRSQKI